jgi:diguanylate cyclase
MKKIKAWESICGYSSAMDETDTRPKGEAAVGLTALSATKKVAAFLSHYKGSAQIPIALLLVGIKDLKQINERLGRKGGDALIQAAGKILTRFAATDLHDAKFLAKMPGREFLLVLPGDKSAADLESITRKILLLLAADFGKDTEPVHISARIGLAISEPDESGDELLHRAGIALASAYSRKGKKFAFEVYKKAQGSAKNSAIDAGLRGVINDHQITIVLQPQFEVASGRLIGAEALARLQHELLGEVGAEDLFAAADRCDLREELSHVIQAEAIAIAADWPAALDDLRLSVNLGAEELGEGYSARLEQILLQTGFDPARLTLELTEESLVRDIDLANEQLAKLRAKHIRIAVDDFGTGYSSLAYLKDLPLDYLKIDKGMTPDINGTGKDRIILRAIIAMGQALGLKIIAEGVEQEEELQMLAAEGCDYFQGFLRSQPLTPDDFERFALLSN